MQVKLKNANAASRFLLAHGEKLGIATVGVLALLLVWKSIGREKLGPDLQANALESRAKDAADHVRGVIWQDIDEKDKVVAAEAIEDPSEAVLTPVRAGDFPQNRQFNPPVTIPLNKRTDPVLLAALAPEANGGAGLWLSADPDMLNKKRLEAIAMEQEERLAAEAAAEAARREAEEDRDRRRGRGGRDREDDLFADGRGGTKTKDGAIIVQPTSGAQVQDLADVRNRYWVTVLAKVPISQQHQMYRDALENTRGYEPSRDAPVYFGYVVQRAEITDKGQGPWKSLPGVTPVGVANIMGTWPLHPPDLINPRYNHPLLTFPLPPMIIRPWGDEITHSELPLQTPEEMLYEMQPEMPAEDEPDLAEGVDNDEAIFAREIERQRAQANPQGLEARMYGPEGMGMEMGGRLLPAASYGPEGGMGRSGLGAEGEIVLPPYIWDGQTEFLLFRYFDSQVQPGSSYRYRIQLALTDVNAGQLEALLDPKVVERQAANNKGYFLTEWSEESPVATVPQPGLVFVKGAKISPNPHIEPEAELLVKSLNSEFAAEIGIKDLFTRGSVLNLKQQAQVIWSSLYDVQQQPESPPFEFFTGMTLLDFDGGDKITNRGLLAPVRAVLMDSSGRMVLHNELEDAPPVAEFEAIIEADKAASRERPEERRGRGRGPEG